MLELSVWWSTISKRACIFGRLIINKQVFKNYAKNIYLVHFDFKVTGPDIKFLDSLNSLLPT